MTKMIWIWGGIFSSISLEFKPQDLWIGAYWQVDKCDALQEQVRVWICLLPTLPICIRWTRNY